MFPLGDGRIILKTQIIHYSKYHIDQQPEDTHSEGKTYILKLPFQILFGTVFRTSHNQNQMKSKSTTFQIIGLTS